MKQLKSGLYKAANVTFNPATLDAHSYVWWRFVAKIGGKVVFNSYAYSITTQKHQYKVRRLLYELGIEIDIELQVPRGIEQGAKLRDLKRIHAHELARQADALEAKRIARNKVARERRASKQQSVVLTSVQGGA